MASKAGGKAQGAKEAVRQFQKSKGPIPLEGKFHSDLKSFLVRIDTLTPDPENARKHSDENLDAIENSLLEFGQRKPVIVQKKGKIIRAGNGTVEAAKRLGWTHVAALFVDEDDNKAKAFAIADNRTAELAEWDSKQLYSLIEELEAEAPSLVMSIGFDERDIERLSARFGDTPQTKTTEPADKVGKKTLSLTYAAPDYEELKAALDYLKAVYKMTNNEDAAAQAFKELANHYRNAAHYSIPTEEPGAATILDVMSGKTSTGETEPSA